jgi:hypothetical protein
MNTLRGDKLCFFVRRVSIERLILNAKLNL